MLGLSLAQGDDWPQSLGKVNTAMGWVILGLMLLANTPLLDFRSITLASQLARVEAGEIKLEEFGFYYARERLARPAWLKMQALIEEHESSDPELAQFIREPYPWPRKRRLVFDYLKMTENTLHPPKSAPSSARTN